MADDAARLRRQTDLVLDWVTSDDARRSAQSLATRHGLDIDAADLVQQAWVRVTTSLGVRTEPLPAVDSSEDAARYGYRILANLAIDAVRSANRRAVSPVDLESREVAGPEDSVLATVFLEELLRRLAAAPIRPGNCGGCSPDMIRSIASRAVQTIALERERAEIGDRGNFDSIIDEAVGRVSGGSDDSTRRKRKSRCIGCVREVVARVMAEMEVGRE